MHWQIQAFFWPAFWILFWAARSAIKHRRRLEELKIASAASALNQPPVDTAEIKDLRERVKVLERITVDERHSRAISDEIEALRDR